MFGSAVHGEDIMRLVSLIFALLLAVPGWVLFYLSSRRMTGKVAWAIRLLTYACLFLILDSVVRNSRTVFAGIHAETFYIYIEEVIYIIAYLLFFLGSYTLHHALQLVSNLQENPAVFKEQNEPSFFTIWKPFLSPYLYLKRLSYNLTYKLAMRLKEEGWVKV